MTQDFGIGIVYAQAVQELLHRYLLGQGAGVGRMAVRVEAALIADAYRVGIVVADMGPDLALRSTGIEGAVLGDVIMIADVAEPTGFVTGFQSLYREVLVYSGGATVHHNQIDVSHDTCV